MNKTCTQQNARLSSKYATFIAIAATFLCVGCGKINEAMKVPEPDTVVEKTKDITENQKGVFVETLFPDGTLSRRLKGEKGDTLLAAEVHRGEVIRIIKVAPGQLVCEGKGSSTDRMYEEMEYYSHPHSSILECFSQLSPRSSW